MPHVYIFIQLWASSDLTVWPMNLEQGRADSASLDFVLHNVLIRTKVMKSIFYRYNRGISWLLKLVIKIYCIRILQNNVRIFHIS